MSTTGNKQQFLIEVLLTCKCHMPKKLFMYGLFLFIKFVGILIISNTLEQVNDKESLDFSISNALLELTYFKNLQGGLPNIDYDALCFLIWGFMLLPLGCLLVFYKTKRKGKIPEWVLKFIVPLFSYVTFIIVFFSQHLVEILIFPLICMLGDTRSKDLRVDLVQSFANFNKQFIMNNAIYGGINFLFIILVNIYLYFFFKLMANPSIGSRYPIRIRYTNTFLIILLFIFNFQGIHVINKIYTNAWTINLIMLIISLFLTILLLLLCIRRFIFPSFCSYLLLFLILFTMYSSGITLLFFVKLEGLSQSIYVLKGIIQLILALVTMKLIVSTRTSLFAKKIISNIFVKNKMVNSEYTFELVNIISQCINDIKNLTTFFDLIDAHKTKCKKDDCLCGLFVSTKYYEFFRSRSTYSELKRQYKLKEFHKNFNDFLTLTENEIINFIYNLSKNKLLNSTNAGDFILLHCDFVLHYRKRYLYSLYLIHQYMCRMQHLPYDVKFHLLEYRRQLMEKLMKSKNANKISKKFSNFMKFFLEINDITDSVAKCCDRYLSIIHFQNSYLDLTNLNKFNLSTGDMTFQNVEKLFIEGRRLNKTYKDLCTKLNLFYNEEALRNPEICYILTRFFMLINKSIPKEVEGLFLQIHFYSIVDNFDSCFLDLRFEHPIILRLESRDKKDKHGNEFTIRYISQKLCDSLGYPRGELLDKDFHCLFPSSFGRQHSLLMKRYVLIEGNFKFEKSAFVLSKEQYHIQAHVVCESLPAINAEIKIICDVSLRQNYLCDYSNFSFILDADTNFLTLSRNFSDKYYFNTEMLIRLNVNFCNLFNINMNQLNDFFKDSYEMIRKIELESTEHLVTIFSYSELNDAIKANSASTKFSLKGSQAKEQTFIRLKEKLLPTLDKIKKTIQEVEYDAEWVRKISELERMFSGGANFKRTIKSSPDKGNAFLIQMRIKNIGNVPYFYVKVLDRENVTIDLSRNKGNEVHNLMETELESKPVFLSSIKLAGHKRKLNALTNTAVFNPNSLSPGVIKETLNSSIIVNDSFNHLLDKGDGILMNKLRENDNKINKGSLPIELKRHSKVCEMITNFLLKILILTLFIFFSFNFSFKPSVVLHSKDLFIINSSGMMLKSYAFQLSIFMSTACIEVDNGGKAYVEDIVIPLSFFKDQIKRTTSQMFQLYKEFKQVLIKKLHLTEIKEINNLLNEKNEYKILNPNWTETTRLSTFDDEFHYFHFNLGYITGADNFKRCLARNFVVQRTDKDFTQQANPEEIMLYYINNNLPKLYSEKLETITRLTNLIVDTQTKIQIWHAIYYDVCMLIIAILLTVIIWKIVSINKNKIFYLLFKFLIRTERQMTLEKSLIKLKSIMINYDREKCESFEGLDMATTLIPRTFLISRETSSPKNLNRSSSRKKKSKIDPFEKKTEENESTKNLAEIEEKQKKIFSIKVVRFSIYILIIAFVGYVVILANNIYFSINEFEQLNFANQISTNFLDETPKFIEIICFYRISMTLNNPYFITIPQSLYPNLEYSNSLNISIPIENDSTYQILGNSKFAYLSYVFQVNQLNIIKFSSNEKYNSVLPTTRKQAAIFNSPAFCSVMGKYSVVGNQTEEEATQVCLRLGNGLNKQGLSQSITHSFNSFVSTYIDFVKAGGTANVTSLLGNKEYLQARLNIFKYYTHVNEFYYESIMNDMNEEYNKMMKNQLIYSIIGFMFNLVFIFITLLIILNKIVKFYKDFSETMDKFKSAVC